MYFVFILIALCAYLNTVSNIWSLNPNMKITRFSNGIIIIDDFYKYPNKIRNFALQQNFKPHNTLYKSMFFNPNLTCLTHYNIVQCLEKIERKSINKQIWDTFTKTESNGFFQYITKFDKPVIHSDGLKRSMIVYLFPNPKVKSGTAFYRHKDTGIYKETSYNDGKLVDSDLHNKEKWTCHFVCENNFNRAVIFDGNMYHSSEGGFGKSKSDARLYQTFFYNLPHKFT